MKLGLFAAITDTSPPITALAPAIEERGFESLWLPEHSHIPTNSVLQDGRKVPRSFARLHDPFVLLAAAAAVTRRIKLATGVCLLVQRDTIATAKTLASLAQLSDGRALFGVGAGWNRAELANHGVQFDKRFKKLDEQMQALRAIWRDDEAQFHGEQVAFGPMWCWPKPAAGQTPPILIGGESEHTLRRVVKYGDGWLPRMHDVARVEAGITRLRELATQAGREPATLSINLFGAPAGADDFKRYRDAGADRVIVALQLGTLDECLQRLDRLAELKVE